MNKDITLRFSYQGLQVEVEEQIIQNLCGDEEYEEGILVSVYENGELLADAFFTGYNGAHDYYNQLMAGQTCLI